MHPRRVPTPLTQFHAVSAGAGALWPCAGDGAVDTRAALAGAAGRAIAAGNCVVLKPSNYAPHTAQALQSLIEDSPCGLGARGAGRPAGKTKRCSTAVSTISSSPAGAPSGRLVMEKARAASHARVVGIGRQKPRARAGRCGHPPCGQAHRVRQAPQLRADLRCARLCAGAARRAGAADRGHEAGTPAQLWAAIPSPIRNIPISSTKSTRSSARPAGARGHSLWRQGRRPELEPTLVACSGRDEPVMQEDLWPHPAHPHDGFTFRHDRLCARGRKAAGAVSVYLV